MHYVTLNFDDGFRVSSVKTADIFEKHGLRADFNVLAEPARGDFGLWNELQARGHVIQPHGYNHTDKSRIPLAEAQGLICLCLDIFGERLAGFNAKSAIFNFPNNASTPDLEAWLPAVVRAFRTEGPATNPLPTADTVKILSTGAEEAEECLDRWLAELLSRPDGWLVYSAHGLDGEGWGPLRSSYLDRLLGALVEREDVSLLPATAVLAIHAGGGPALGASQ
jgi:peptidoglycan/xylan/chitin deacetylase (PgdA/CDA1 family)